MTPAQRRVLELLARGWTCGWGQAVLECPPGPEWPVGRQVGPHHRTSWRTIVKLEELGLVRRDRELHEVSITELGREELARGRSRT